MKMGISVKLDVTKIDKDKLYQGKNGKYLDLTLFLDTEETSEYGDNGTVTQSASKEDREAGRKPPIIGNAKVFYQSGQPKQAQKDTGNQHQAQNMGDDVPF